MSPGHFVWYDIATTDPEAASRFYADVVGWAAKPMPDLPYTVFEAAGERVAGAMALPPNLQAAGVPPHWTGYIGVADVDAKAAELQQAGGSLRHGPEDIPGTGRFAVVADPAGAVFHLFTPSGPAGAEPAPMTVGRVGWNELRGGVSEASLAFYGKLFGWERGAAIDMGPMGTYQLFAYGGTDRGGMMAAPPGQHPAWLFYFTVPGLDAAKARVERGGGQVQMGPQEVPGGGWVLTGRDPQGAAFALFSAAR